MKHRHQVTYPYMYVGLHAILICATPFPWLFVCPIPLRFGSSAATILQDGSNPLHQAPLVQKESERM